MYRLLFSAIIFSVLSGAGIAVAADPVKSYTIDPSHTRVLYFISHLGFSKLPGQFNDVTGTIHFSPNDAKNSRVDVQIKAASLSMGNEALDKKLQGAEYFNTGKFPTIRFVSTAVEKTGAAEGVISGDLTLLGVTKPIKLDVRFNHRGFNKYAKADAIGFSATGKIRRSDFGMMTLLPDVGDDIDLRIEAEAGATPPGAEATAETKVENPAVTAAETPAATKAPAHVGAVPAAQ